jgi:hypothetical protein
MARLTAIKESISTLATICAADDLTLTLATGEGANFPASGDYLLRIGAGATYEIVRATSRTADVITIIRAQDDTTAIEHAAETPVYTVISHTYLSEIWWYTVKVGAAVLVAGNANAIAGYWQNPEPRAIFILGGVLYVSAAGDAGSVMDVGSAANPTTHGDDLLAGVPLDLSVPRGWDFTGRCLLDEAGGATDYITFQILTANAASLAGKYFIFYVTAP